MVNIRKFLQGIGLIPVSSTTIDTKGELEVLDASGKLNYHNGTTASPVVTEAHAATLTNKTMDGGSNTFTNIPTSSISGTVTVPNGGTGVTSLTSNGVVIGNGTSAVTVTAEGATGTVLHGNTGADPSFSAVVNADIDAAAAIAFSKLAALPSAEILVGSAGNVATATAVTGDVTISNTGVTAIGSGVIVNADINASAAIERTKIANGTADHVVINDGSGTLSSEANLAVSRGGTGVGSLTSNGVVIGNGTSAVTVTAEGATGTVLRGNTGADPSFGAVALTTDVTGTLPVANGGTGATTFTDAGVLIGNGTGAVQVTSAGTAGQVLTSNGAGVDPTFQNASGGGSNTVVASSYSLANWPITVNQYGDLASVSLAAGTWMITLYNYVYNNGTTNLTTVQAGVTTHSGNNSTDLDQANANFYDVTPWNNTSQNVYILTLSGVIVTHGSTTTYYAKGFAAGTNTTNLRAGGRISAVKLI